MAKKISNTLRIIIEALVLAVVPLLLNLLLSAETGFLNWFAIPYLTVAVIFTFFYGFWWGLLELLLTFFFGFLLFPLIKDDFNLLWFAKLLQALRFSGPLMFVAWMISGYSYQQRKQFVLHILQRLKKHVYTAQKNKRMINSLERVGRVLENRVSNQKDSITLLRAQVKKLSALDMTQALNTMLESVNLFTETSSASIWVASSESGRLKTAAVFGWEEDPATHTIKRESRIGLDGTVEGYVFRNGKPFSIRMMLGSQEFYKLDISCNIICLPIRIRGQVWGVLNIEEMPFEQYSLYTESVLEILINLMEPYLADILEHETLFDQREMDEDTGLPQVSQLYRTLERELEQISHSGGQLSLIVLELSNWQTLLEDWSKAQLKKLFSKIRDAFEEHHKVKSKIFHFKNSSQLAFLIQGLDQDGTSFFCLDLLSLIPGLALDIDGKIVLLEVIVGFSTSGDSLNSSNAMIEMAETLLEMQRV